MATATRNVPEELSVATRGRNMGRKMPRLEGMCTRKMFVGVHVCARLLDTRLWEDTGACKNL